MTRRTTTIVTTAASLVLGCGAGFAQQTQNPSGMGPQNGLPAGEPVQSMPSGVRSMQDSEDMAQQIKQFAQDPTTAVDKLFVLHAACGNQEEIEMARQAESKAQNPQVKAVARQIQQDHEKANQQLRPIAQQLGVQIPQSVPAEKQQVMQLLISLPTDQFEKQYITMMQAGHAMALVEYRATAQLSQNEQVRQYAQQQLPTLMQHYGQVQQAGVALGLPGSGPEAIPASGRIEGIHGDPTGVGSGVPRSSSEVGNPNGSGSARSGNRVNQSGAGSGNPVIRSGGGSNNPDGAGSSNSR